MSKIESIIYKINRELISTFAVLDSWFDRNEDFLRLKPEYGWSIAEVLEHVMLTNRYLLLLLDKAGKKAIRKAAETDLRMVIQSYNFEHPLLEQVRNPAAFQWHRPEHMQPGGDISLHEVRDVLRDQLYHCMCLLEMLSNGEGVLHQTTLSVNNIGKLDVYQYIYFLVLHGKRHLVQLETTAAKTHFSNQHGKIEC